MTPSPGQASLVFAGGLSSAGVGIWARTLGNGTGASGYSLAVDSLGSTLVVGAYRGDISLNGTSTITNPSVVEKNGFIAKLDSSGAGVWLTDMPKAAGGLVAIDSTDDLLVASIEKDGTLGVSKRVSGTGGVVWNRVSGIDTAALAVGKQGEVFLGGAFKGALTFDSFILNTNSGVSYEIFLAKIAP